MEPDVVLASIRSTLMHLEDEINNPDIPFVDTEARLHSLIDASVAALSAESGTVPPIPAAAIAAARAALQSSDLDRCKLALTRAITEGNL